MPPWVWTFSLAANQKASQPAIRAADAAIGSSGAEVFSAQAPY